MPDTTSKGPMVKSMYVFHAAEIDCKNVLGGLEPLVISYQVNQSADLQLWDGNFCTISLFGIDKYLESDARNITCSLS